MLKHLVKHGYQVTACDLDADATRQGARSRRRHRGLAGGARHARPISSSWASAIRTRSTPWCTAPDGLHRRRSPKGAIIAISSTVSPYTVQAIDAAAKPKGIGVLDAPICRGRWAADEGTLLAMVGGAPDVVERGRAVYGCFCSDYAHLGDVGHGQVGKTMNNLLLWINSVGLIEAGRLAETTGIDLVKLRDALQISSGASAALNDWDMITFTWALKDMQVVAEMTDKAGLSLPITGAVKELVKEARRIKATNPPNWTGSKRRRFSRCLMEFVD